MKLLPNNCRIGKMSVVPKNWKTTKGKIAESNLKSEWYIVYRFYDDNTGKVRQIKKRGMNDLESLSERITATKYLLANELELLESGYNPITNQQFIEETLNPDIPTENTPFNMALDMALKSIDVEKHTKEDLTSVSGFIKAEIKEQADSGNNDSLFLEMVNPVCGTVENTLDYIESKIIEANLPHNIFKTIEKTKKGNNQTGLNAEIAAMVHMFQNKGYFKSGFTFKDLFRSFGQYTNNQAGKDYDFVFFIWNTTLRRFSTFLKL